MNSLRASDREATQNTAVTPDDPETRPTLDIGELRRNPPKLMSVRECAIFLGVGVVTVRTLVAERKIPFLRLRGRVLFVSTKLIAALERM